jgi:hypothetical protein
MAATAETRGLTMKTMAEDLACMARSLVVSRACAGKGAFMAADCEKAVDDVMEAHPYSFNAVDREQALRALAKRWAE